MCDYGTKQQSTMLQTTRSKHLRMQSLLLKHRCYLSTLKSLRVAASISLAGHIIIRCINRTLDSICAQQSRRMHDRRSCSLSHTLGRRKVLELVSWTARSCLCMLRRVISRFRRIPDDVDTNARSFDFASGQDANPAILKRSR